MIKFQTDITLSSIQYTGKTIGREEGMLGIIGKVNVKNEIKCKRLTNPIFKIKIKNVILE